ncbi:hypothetical protein [Jannaschia sp. 2305UL9-9]|uniref:hypothetical protein n=1 Tax=Jannaschia sp. 2305UL9-9 TaxID=3121638 RepID=UPI0035285FDD
MTLTLKRPIPPAAAVLLAMVLGGCVSSTGNRTADGAILGGLAGATVGGVASDGDLEKAVIGGAIGAGIGASVAQNTN